MEAKKKRLSREEKVQLLVKDLINEMFRIAGHDVKYDDIVDRKDDWYTNWTMTHSQGEEWKQWGIVEIKKRLRISQYLAEREMGMINLMWGLKYSDGPPNYN